jgi:hypothetical protein
MSEQSDKQAGQTCRKSPCGIIRCLLTAAIIASIIYLFCTRNCGPQNRRLWIPMVVETNGSQTILGETRQLEFWTPSAKTKEFIHMENGKPNDKDKWQIIPSDDMVTQFGSTLHSNQNVLGYRRIEVWGQGRTSYKPGWWWTMNVTTNFTVGELAKDYRVFWKSPQAVLVEVIDNRGSGDK